MVVGHRVERLLRAEASLFNYLKFFRYNAESNNSAVGRRNRVGGRMADAKTAIESMNRRLLVAEGQVTALKEMVHLLVHLARTTNPNLTCYLHEAIRTLDAIEVSDEQTSTYLNAAAGLIAEVIDAKDEPPKFAVIDGGKSDDPV